MTNFEKYKDFILDHINKGEAFGLYGGQLRECDEISCMKCELVSDQFCDDGWVKVLQWMLSEYEEHKKLTRRQRAFCEAVGTGWIARDKSGYLFAYSVMPIKRSNKWTTPSCISYFDISSVFFTDFPFIKWEDDEPYSIEDMLKWEVEDES